MNSHAFSTLRDNKLIRVYRPDWGRRTDLLFISVWRDYKPCHWSDDLIIVSSVRSNFYTFSHKPLLVGTSVTCGLSEKQDKILSFAISESLGWSPHL